MRRLTLAVVIATILIAARALPAQENTSLKRAASAYRDLEYGDAIAFSRQALRERLRAADQERAHEILGFAYAALDSARQATDAFKQLILLNPDRDLDASRISPKITSLFALARTQVLVVRRFEVDSTAFVAGAGAFPFRFTVTRAARFQTRIAGAGKEVVVDSSRGEGTARLQWNGLMSDGLPAASGSYRIIVEASAGRESYAASFPVRVIAGAVDTMTHLTTLPGYDPLPETVVPPRSWRPFALASLAAAVIAGGSVALENGELGSGGRRELVTVGAGTMLIGLLATAKQPAAVPSPANIRYNSLVREQLARRNAEVAAANTLRRRQVQLTVVPQRGTGGEKASKVSPTSQPSVDGTGTRGSSPSSQ